MSRSTNEGDWSEVAVATVGELRVGVFKDRAGRLLLADGCEGVATVSQYDHAEVPLGETLTLVGGRLPGGAVIAEVHDHAGNRHRAQTAGGAWIMVVPQVYLGARIKTPVCYLDASGMPVRMALPPGLNRVPVSDATAECPACGATEWDQLVDDGSAPFDPHSVTAGAAVWVACRSCGHNERIGLIRLDRAQRQRDIVQRPEPAEPSVPTLRAAGFPVYAATGLPARLQGCTRSGGALASVTIVQTPSDADAGAVVVRTSLRSRRRARPGTAAWDLIAALSDQLKQAEGDAEADTRTITDAAAVIASRAELRRTVRLAARGRRTKLRIAIDGETEPFTCIEAAGVWAAERTGRQPSIVVSGRGAPTPLRLSRLVETDNSHECP